jgi:hypothetical protein
MSGEPCDGCGGVIDGLDLQAVHRCGKCAAPYSRDVCVINDRIFELEHEKVQLLDAAAKLAERPSIAQGITVVFASATHPARLGIHPDSMLGTTPETVEYAVRPETVKGVWPAMQAQIHAMGDWSTLKAQQKEATDLRHELRQVKARCARLLKWACVVAGGDVVSRDDASWHADIVNGDSLVAAVRAAHRMGGDDAVEACIIQGAEEDAA